MSIADRVAYDIECMRDFFTRLFSFAEASAKEPPKIASGSLQFLPRGIAYLVRPDMACNVYSLIDFWLAELCLYHQRRSNLSVTLEAFKKAQRKCNDLQKYKRYLSRHASLDMSPVQSSFNHINSLREVRNVFIHAGGHVSAKKHQLIAAIPGVSIQGSLVILTDQFIWQSMDHASRFLFFIAEG